MPQVLIPSLDLQKIDSSTGVIPAKHAILTTEQRKLLDRLNRFDAPYLHEKLLDKGVFSSKEEYQEAFIEFKKYVALTQIFSGPIGMASSKVDSIWHQFILFTKQKTEGIINFLRQYKMVFGEIPKIWDLHENSVCNCDGCDPS